MIVYVYVMKLCDRVLMFQDYIVIILLRYKKEIVMKKILSIVVLAFVLIGCSNSAANTLCNYDGGDRGKFEVTLESKKDLLLKYTEVVTADYTDELEDGSFTKEQLTTIYDARKASLDTKVGFSYSYVPKDNAMVETVVIDYNKVDFKDLYEMDLIDVADAKSVSLEKTISNLEAAGYTCDK